MFGEGDTFSKKLMRLTFLVLVGSVLVWAYLIFRMQRADFWKSQIVAFEKPDSLHPPQAKYWKLPLTLYGRKLHLP